MLVKHKRLRLYTALTCTYDDDDAGVHALTFIYDDADADACQHAFSHPLTFTFIYDDADNDADALRQPFPHADRDTPSPCTTRFSDATHIGWP